MAILGSVIAICCIVINIQIASNLPKIAEESEKENIELQNIADDVDFQHTLIIESGLKILGSGSTAHIFMTGSVLASEAMNISKKIISLNNLTKEQKKYLYESSILSIKKLKDLRSKTESLHIKSTKNIAELKYQNFLFKLLSGIAVFGILLAHLGFYLWILAIKKPINMENKK